MQIMSSVHLDLFDNLWPQALKNKCHRNSLLSGGAIGWRTGVLLLSRQRECLYQLCFCILWACGQSRSCVWEKINSGAVKVRPEERMTSPRQSTESQHNACQPSPSITHVLLLVYNNKVCKRSLKQNGQQLSHKEGLDRNTGYTSWTLKSKRQSLHISLLPPHISLLFEMLKHIGSDCCFTMCSGSYRGSGHPLSKDLSQGLLFAQQEQNFEYLTTDCICAEISPVWSPLCALDHLSFESFELLNVYWWKQKLSETLGDTSVTLWPLIRGIRPTSSNTPFQSFLASRTVWKNSSDLC